jgi:hypothetical protein
VRGIEMTMEIIDSHTHWGPSVSMGIEVTTEGLLGQAEQSGVSRIVIFPFPSMALKDEGINERLLDEANRINPIRNSSCCDSKPSGALNPAGIILKSNPAAEQRGIISNGVKKFIPYYYIPETMKPIPLGNGFYGGKWHWMRGIQDCSSNYHVLEDPKLKEFIEASEKIGLPIVFEEELAFTEAFVKKTKDLKVIIPHLGALGGNPIDFLDIFKARENVCFDTALASSDIVMKFFKKIGHQRILFGSDVPFGAMKRELEKILSLRIGDDKKEWILSKNLKGLIGLR